MAAAMQIGGFSVLLVCPYTNEGFALKNAVGLSIPVIFGLQRQVTALKVSYILPQYA